MSYGIIQKLLIEKYNRNSVVLIESPFMETTRDGKYLGSVRLALASNGFAIASKETDLQKNNQPMKKSSIEILYSVHVHPIKTVKLSIFKNSLRQSLKARFNNMTRYFELGETKKRMIFWSLWCNHIAELNSATQLWPFCDVSIKIQTSQHIKQKWSDKYLYMGTKREAEDKVRPVPVPGLGPTEDIKLMYLKPQYFGCWEQSDHWVQCASSGEALCDYDIYTYTGEPTSNVTYTSLMTTWK